MDEKTKTTKKHILQTLCFIACIIIITPLIYVIHDRNRGYKTPEETALKYIKAINNNDIYIAKQCYHQDSKNYQQNIDDVKAQILNNNLSIDKNTLKIKPETPYPDINTIRNDTGFDSIDDIIVENITFTTTLNKNDIDMTYLYDYSICMYKLQNKWFITNVVVNNKKNITPNDIEINRIKIGDSRIGTLIIPGNWIRIENNISDEADYISPDEDASVGIGVIKGDEIDINDVISTKIEALDATNTEYTNEDITINGQKCTVIQNLLNNKLCITVFHANILKNTNLYYVELECDPEDKDFYINQLLASYQIY